MPANLDRAFRIFNLLVKADFGSVEAGFREISGLAEGIKRKTVEVILKRGVIGNTDFLYWINKGQFRGRNLKIELLDPSRSKVIRTWTLMNAKPIKYTGSTLVAKGGSEVAIEELVLSCEKVEPL